MIPGRTICLDKDQALAVAKSYIAIGLPLSDQWEDGEFVLASSEGAFAVATAMNNKSILAKSVIEETAITPELKRTLWPKVREYRVLALKDVRVLDPPLPSVPGFVPGTVQELDWPVERAVEVEEQMATIVTKAANLAAAVVGRLDVMLEDFELMPARVVKAIIQALPKLEPILDFHSEVAEMELGTAISELKKTVQVLKVDGINEVELAEAVDSLESALAGIEKADDGSEDFEFLDDATRREVAYIKAAVSGMDKEEEDGEQEVDPHG
jgi:hypothetical protein